VGSVGSVAGRQTHAGRRHQLGLEAFVSKMELQPVMLANSHCSASEQADEGGHTCQPPRAPNLVHRGCHARSQACKHVW